MCDNCGAQLIRKGLESKNRFETRTYCSRKCYNTMKKETQCYRCKRAIEVFMLTKKNTCFDCKKIRLIAKE